MLVDEQYGFPVGILEGRVLFMAPHVALQHHLPVLVNGPLRQAYDLSCTTFPIVPQNADNVIDLLPGDVHTRPENPIIVRHEDSEVGQRPILYILFVDHGMNNDGSSLEHGTLTFQYDIKEISWLAFFNDHMACFLELLDPNSASQMLKALVLLSLGQRFVALVFSF